jgi:hypothetical protein
MFHAHAEVPFMQHISFEAVGVAGGFLLKEKWVIRGDATVRRHISLD